MKCIIASGDFGWLVNRKFENIETFSVNIIKTFNASIIKKLDANSIKTFNTQEISLSLTKFASLTCIQPAAPRTRAAVLM